MTIYFNFIAALNSRRSLDIKHPIEMSFVTSKKSSWMPSKTPHVIETLIEAVSNDINDSQIETIPRANLMSEQRRALRSLQNWENIIIAKADKGEQ